MQDGEVTTLSWGTRLARLSGLWLLTTLWMGLGLLLIATLCLYLGVAASPSLILLLLLWRHLMREGLQTALGRDADRQPDVVAGVYLGFAASQLALFGWLCVQAAGTVTSGLFL